MGRRSHIQKAMDEKMGAHLADFEEEVLEKVNHKLLGRVQEMQFIEKELREAGDRLEKKMDIAQRAVEQTKEQAARYEVNYTWETMAVAVIAGAVGGLLMFFLMWQVW